MGQRPTHFGPLGQTVRHVQNVPYCTKTTIRISIKTISVHYYTVLNSFVILRNEIEKSADVLLSVFFRRLCFIASAKNVALPSPKVPATKRLPSQNALLSQTMVPSAQPAPYRWQS